MRSQIDPHGINSSFRVHSNAEILPSKILTKISCPEASINSITDEIQQLTDVYINANNFGADSNNKVPNTKESTATLNRPSGEEILSKSKRTKGTYSTFSGSNTTVASAYSQRTPIYSNSRVEDLLPATFDSKRYLRNSLDAEKSSCIEKISQSPTRNIRKLIVYFNETYKTDNQNVFLFSLLVAFYNFLQCIWYTVTIFSSCITFF